jgi:osmotically-inducible protein OsmY
MRLFNLRVPGQSVTRQTASDRALTARLMRMLEDDLSISQVRGVLIFVRRGEVRLLGHLESEAEREFLVELIENQPGVKRVVDEVTVTAVPTRS